MADKSGYSRDFFDFYGQRSVAEPGPTPSPWSISCFFSHKAAWAKILGVAHFA